MSSAISRLFQLKADFSPAEACPRRFPTAQLYNTIFRSRQSKSFVLLVFISCRARSFGFILHNSATVLPSKASSRASHDDSGCRVNLMRSQAFLFLLTLAGVGVVASTIPGLAASSEDQTCRVEATKYRGWDAEQLTNRWVQLVIVPQNGGRLMQVTFNGHAYLFNNPKLAGKYFPPTTGKWFNYGGDKLWLLPEGNDDEQHWVGNSDLIDDGTYDFRKLSDGKRCEIELTGPADPQTGVQ